MKLVLHRDDEVGVENKKGVREHGIVHDVSPQIVWVSLDNVCIDIAYALDDPRLSLWPVTA